ncbi:MAG: Ig-like domain-containing protein [Myxococcota bacterium]|nr:Ig-like domain-containing protein [Myxococcota bacterium]
MLWLALLACRDKDSDVIRDPDPSYTTTIDTGLFIDTADTDEPPDTGDTADTSAPEPGVVVESMALYPDGVTVHPGAALPLRLVARWDDGLISDLIASYTSSDEKIATVDKSGVITAHSAGSVTVTADWETLSEDVTLTVIDDGNVTVTVIDATTGSPIEDARIKIFDGDPYATDTHGQVSAPVPDGAPVEVSAYLSDYVPATIWQTVSRDIVIPLYPADAFESRGTATGTVDFDSVDSGEVTELVMGMVLPSMPHGPLMLDPDDLLAEERTVTVFGIDADVPANLVLKNYAEDYEATVIAGEAAVWTIAGAMPISEVTSGLNGTSDAIGLLRDHIDAMVWGFSDAGTISSGSSATIGISPSVPFSEEVDVFVPELSLGFNGAEEPLIMVGEFLPDEGVVVTGLGLGLGEVEVQTAAHSMTGSTGEVAMSIAQVGGLGSGGGVAASWGPVVSGVAALPAFLDIPEVTAFDATSHEFSLTSDTRASFVRVLIEGADGTLRLLYTTSGEHTGVLPDPGFPMGYGNTTWTILAMEVSEDTLEGRLVDGDILSSSIALTAHTAARVGSHFQSPPAKE